MIKIFFFIFLLNFIFLINNYLRNFLSSIIIILLIFTILICRINNFWLNIYRNLGIDWMSILLVFLTMFIISLMIFLVKINNKIYYYLMFSLIIVLLIRFISINLFIFYVFFEIRLIPTFLLIFGWGHQFERINASLYMLIYTLFFSLPFILIIIYIYEELNSLNFIIINDFIIYNDNFLLLLIIISMGFLVKLPIFIIHIWLPKAHVQAPVVGSIILAGIILKLGGYGLFRILDLMVLREFLDFFILIRIFGIIFLRILCLRQFDIKLIVAYSSVVHIGIILIGLYTETVWGIKGAYFIIIGHGLCSSALFIIVNFIYERTKRRNLLINKGIIYFLPSLIIFWFLFCVNNMAAPISLNLLREIFIVNILFDWSYTIIILVMVSMFLRASYNLYLFSFRFHGIYNRLLSKIYSVKVSEFYNLIFHFLPLNLLILKLNFII